MPRIRLSTGVEAKQLADLGWMSGLTNVRIHRLAVLTGSACSGTKSCRIDSVQKSLHVFGHERSTQSDQPLSLVSIDMGIRNLAYAHFTAQAGTSQIKTDRSCHFTGLKLNAWRRFDVSSAMSEGGTSGNRVSNSDLATSMDDKHSTTKGRPSAVTRTITVKHIFEPWTYASQAYALISEIIHLHNPTQILIERQRFRSGGGSAVQEWTIRVGVLEGMLYAVLETLKQATGTHISVTGIQPTRVNSYWLEEGLHHQTRPLEVRPKLAAREAKKIKIDMVGDMLESGGSSGEGMDVHGNAQRSVDEYLGIWRKDLKASKAKVTGPSVKLDDLADCFLQGLAWIRWQKNLRRLQQHGHQAFDLTTN